MGNFKTSTKNGKSSSWQINLIEESHVFFRLQTKRFCSHPTRDEMRDKKKLNNKHKHWFISPMKDSRKILRFRRCCLFEETNYARVWAKARAEPKDKLEKRMRTIFVIWKLCEAWRTTSRGSCWWKRKHWRKRLRNCNLHGSAERTKN